MMYAQLCKGRPSRVCEVFKCKPSNLWGQGEVQSLGQGHIGLYKYEYLFWYLQNFFSLQKMVLMSVDDGSVDENCTMDLNI